MFCLKLCLRSVRSRDEINEVGLSWQTFNKAGRARRERILCIPHDHWTHNTPTVDNTLTYLALPMLMHDLLPSPGSPNKTKYQRRTCHEPVNWEQNCVCCDSCHGPTDRKCHTCTISWDHQASAGAVLHATCPTLALMFVTRPHWHLIWMTHLWVMFHRNGSFWPCPLPYHQDTDGEATNNQNLSIY